MENGPEQRHLLSSFDEALRGLREDAMMMAALAERSLGRASEGLFRQDDQACGMAIADDEEIDQLEVQIDRDGALVLMKFQPVAVDLRMVIGTMRFGVDVERVGDEAVSIARRARRLNRGHGLAETALLEPLFERASGMFRDAAAAFAAGDDRLAREVKHRDVELDAMEGHIARQITARIETDASRSRDLIDLLLVGRNLERVGDHAKNIAEQVIYAVTGIDTRHAKGEG